MSLSSAVMPADFKEAILLPLLKKNLSGSRDIQQFQANLKFNVYLKINWESGGLKTALPFDYKRPVWGISIILQEIT